MKKTELSLETKTVQGLGWFDGDTHSLAPPIYPSTTFLRNEDLSYHNDVKYTRSDNPTYNQVSRLLAELENGYSSQLFSSGMAAAVAIFQALKKGDHIVLPQGVYGGTRHWANKYLINWGIDVSYIPDGDASALSSALISGKTKLVWIETPSNPNWNITDIKSFSEMAHAAGSMVICDNTIATPVLTKPIDFGADIVLHSATKYLNGHGDVLMGVLITESDNEHWQIIKRIAHDGGALPGSFESWLLLRGIRTLYVRMERINKNAMVIAEFLQSHPKVKAVYYPGLCSFPGHDVAKKQMNGGFGGMISIRLGNKESAVKLQGKTNIFRRATSLGTVESLIEHRASYEGAGSPVPDDLIRLSIGIERVDDLIMDLEQALKDT